MLAHTFCTCSCGHDWHYTKVTPSHQCNNQNKMNELIKMLPVGVFIELALLVLLKCLALFMSWW